MYHEPQVSKESEKYSSKDRHATWMYITISDGYILELLNATKKKKKKRKTFRKFVNLKKIGKILFDKFVHEVPLVRAIMRIQQILCSCNLSLKLKQLLDIMSLAIGCGKMIKRYHERQIADS